MTPQKKVRLGGKSNTKKVSKVTKVKSSPIKEKTYTYSGYCNIIGASSGVRLIARLKFSKEGNKTLSEWLDIFKEAKIS
jgi:hypothetical protein